MGYGGHVHLGDMGDMEIWDVVNMTIWGTWDMGDMEIWGMVGMTTWRTWSQGT